MAIARWVAAAAFICVALVTQPIVAQTLSVNTTSSPPLATPQRDGFHDLIAIEVFRRVGRNITIQFLPGERSLINLNQGIDDATMVRISGIEKDFPNVRRVPEKFIDVQFVAYATDPKVEVKEWADLKPYRVAYIRGWKIFEQSVGDATLVTVVTRPSQLFDRLVRGSSDVILFEKWQGLSIIRERGTAHVRELSPPLATKEMFMYVNKKHEALVDKLAAAIRSMKADGTYESIYQRTLAPLLVRE